MSASSFSVGDYAETDRHYGRITSEFMPEFGSSRWFVFLRLECLHGPQKEECRLEEGIWHTQLKPAPSPEELVAQALGEDYL